MSQGANLFFNLITLVFVVLTIVVAAITFGVASESMDPPFLAPPTDEPTTTPWAQPPPEPIQDPETGEVLNESELADAVSTGSLDETAPADGETLPEESETGAETAGDSDQSADPANNPAP
ncbi:MAG: hypothetical protein GYB65_24155 [Chloroflexi bacterium]|nr:hypothetical protein [Chloroflexota bacterium]